MTAVRLYVTVAAWALWFGGFAFYFGVVVPTGGKVLGGSEQGFVTQQVTHWLNLIGVAVLPILLWNALASKSWFLLATWVGLAALHAGLFVMHGQLDVLIDAPSRSVTNAARFHLWHERYETTATVEFAVGMVYLAGIVRAAWSARSTHPASPPSGPRVAKPPAPG